LLVRASIGFTENGEGHGFSRVQKYATMGHEITEERRTQYGNSIDQDSTGPHNGRKA
jgi:hypothetical protein